MAASVSSPSSGSGQPSRHNNKVLSLFPSASSCIYTQNYCEENVWKLCESVRESHPNELAKCSAVFVSNPDRSVPLWCQRAADTIDLPLIWDYHVIFMYQPDHRCLIYDLDSKLPFPTYFHKYVTETFRSDSIFKPNHHRYFRVIPATTYLETFSSDRSHMKKPDGSWFKTPPSYEPILTEVCKNNVDSFFNMDPNKGPGEVFNLKQFVTRYYTP